MIKDELDVSKTAAKIEAMQTLGVPYEEGYAEKALDDLWAQAKEIADELNQDPDIIVTKDKEIIALIAYLQRLGVDIKTEE